MASSIKKSSEGLWRRKHYAFGTDSQLRHLEQNPNNPYSNKTNTLMMGTVMFPHPEPIYKQPSVAVDLVTNGWLTSVAWPGGHVEANLAGLNFGLALSIHGLWESPLPGQEVLIGFVDGNGGNPVVVQKYPYNASQRPDLDIMHFLPFFTKFIGPTDVILGHHTASFIALRGILPLPGEIDIFTFTVFNVIAGVGVSFTGLGIFTVNMIGAATITSGGAVAITAGAAVAISAGAAISLVATAAITITAGGIVSVVGVPGLNVNAGVFPVACVGDLVPTMLGPMPVAPGPGRIPTSLTTT